MTFDISYHTHSSNWQLLFNTNCLVSTAYVIFLSPEIQICTKQLLSDLISVLHDSYMLSKHGYKDLDLTLLYGKHTWSVTSRECWM